MNTEKEMEQCHHGLLTKEASGLHPHMEGHGLGNPGD